MNAIVKNAFVRIVKLPNGHYDVFTNIGSQRDLTEPQMLVLMGGIVCKTMADGVEPDDFVEINLALWKKQ